MASTTWSQLTASLSDRDTAHLQDLVGVDLIDSLRLLQRELASLSSIAADLTPPTASICQSPELDRVLRQIAIVIDQCGVADDDRDPVIEQVRRRQRSRPEPSVRRRQRKLSGAAALAGDEQALIDIRRALVADQSRLRIQIDHVNAEIEDRIAAMVTPAPITLADARQTLVRVRQRWAQIDRLVPVVQPATKLGGMRRPPGQPIRSGRRLPDQA